MKIKPLYIYSALILITAIVIIFLTTTSSTKTENTASTPIQETEKTEMPNDDVHKNLKPDTEGMPNSSNVSEDITKMMETMKVKVEANPNDTLIIHQYADFLSAAHKPDEALKYYNMILKKDPNRIDIYFAEALVHFNKQDYSNAEATTRKVLKIDSKNPQALYNLGAIAANRGDNATAKKYWNEVLSNNPNAELKELINTSIARLK
jgi:Flp pilus assembly protein TadD